MSINKIIFSFLIGIAISGLSIDAHSSSFSKFAMDDTDREIQDYKKTFQDEVLKEELEPDRQILLNSHEEICVYLRDSFSFYNKLLQDLLKLQKYGSGDKDPSQVSLFFENLGLDKSIDLMKMSCNGNIQNMDRFHERHEMFINCDLLHCFTAILLGRSCYLETRYLNMINSCNGKGPSFPITIEKEMNKLTLFNQLQARNSILMFEHVNKTLKDLCCAMNGRGESEKYIPLLYKSPILKKYIFNEIKSHPRPDECDDDFSDFIKNNFTLVKTYKNGMEKKEIFHNDDLPKLYEDKSDNKYFPLRIDHLNQKQRKIASKSLLKIEKDRHEKEVRAQQVQEMKQVERELERQAFEKRKNHLKIKSADNQNVISAKSKSKKNNHSNKSEESNEAFIICSPQSEKYIPPAIRIKKKTRGVPNPLFAEKNKDLSSTVEEKNELPDIEVHGTIWSLVNEFWQSKAGFTYEKFKTLFTHLGGHIDETTGSSHMVLIYKNEQGETIKGGIWKYHYPVTAFGFNSTKLLKDYMEDCHLTLNRIFPLLSRDM